MTSLPVPLLDDRRAPTAKDDRCGCGCLIVTREMRRFTLPLRAVSFSAKVVERVAEVTVEQTFENTYAELLEAVYIFPLPGGAAVSRFELHVDGKKLVGIVEERGEARRQYTEALAQGKKAALLEQERDDVFTVKVGNLPPRSIATVKMVYSERLPAFDDGETELRIPLVVAPRYIPGQELERASLGDGTESDTTSVPDASRISPPRLAPGLRGDVKLEIAVELLASDSVDELGCTQHATKLAGSGSRLTVALARKDELLDRDFVLRWKTAAAEEKPVLLVAKKNGECYGLLSLVPPKDAKDGQGARDVVFLLDRSGSMAGPKMDSAKRAVSRLLSQLQPHDRFALCVFSDHPKWLTEGFLAADAAGKREALAWLAQRGADGGTELDAALDQCLRLFENESNVVLAGGMKKIKPQAPRLPVLVLVTDGEVGNESEVLRRVEDRLASVRVFTLGIDTAVNAAFLRRLAHLGRGTATFCNPGPDLEAALGRIGMEIGTPVLLDIEVADRGLGFDPASLTPERLPDLFAGRTASIFFRCRSLEGALRVRAKRAEGGVFEQVVSAETVDMAALSQLWAKSRVSDLEDRYRLAYGGAGGGLEAARAEILGIALEHQLLTRFTAFLVIDHSEVETRLAKRKIVQAVETPAQWGGKAEAQARLSAKPSGAVRRIPSRGAPDGSFAPPAARGRRMDDTAECDGAIFGADPFGAPSGSLGASKPPANAPAPGSGAFELDDEIDGLAASDVSMPCADLSPSFGGAPFVGGPAPGGDPFAAPGAPEEDVLFGGGAPFGVEMAPPPVPERWAASPAPAPPPPPSKAGPVSGGRPDTASFRREMAPIPPQLPRSRPVPPPAPPLPPARPLAVVIDELAKALAAVLAALDRGEWPQDGGFALAALRDECLGALQAHPKAARAARTLDLVARALGSVIATIRRREGKPVDFVHPVRGVYEALGAQCRSELAPLLGAGGSPWEATI